MTEIDVTNYGARGHAGPISHSAVSKITSVELVRFFDQHGRHPDHNEIIPLVTLEMSSGGHRCFYFDDLCPDMQRNVEDFMCVADEKDDILVRKEQI